MKSLQGRCCARYDPAPVREKGVGVSSSVPPIRSSLFVKCPQYTALGASPGDPHAPRNRRLSLLPF